MEQELWKLLYALACRLDKSWPRGLYKDCEIVGVFLWAVIHDRPTCWATDLKNWPANWNMYIYVPSQSTMSRRLGSIGVSEEGAPPCELRAGGVPPQQYCRGAICAKPLPIGG